jgi:hypothetical protein
MLPTRQVNWQSTFALTNHEKSCSGQRPSCVQGMPAVNVAAVYCEKQYTWQYRTPALPMQHAAALTSQTSCCLPFAVYDRNSEGCECRHSDSCCWYQEVNCTTLLLPGSADVGVSLSEGH